ncbi:MAG: 3-methylornithine--L-lysine ligase PylC [Thermoleophilia bacterium]
MRLLIVGGRLQGTEAAYLAAKAGIETVLVDRCPTPPAVGLVDRFVAADITADEARSRALARSCDAILPACENLATLEWLSRRATAWDVPLLFDLPAYRVTASKSASWRLFDALGVDHPAGWPDCAYPVVVKPDAASGSEGVVLAKDAEAVLSAQQHLRATGHDAVVEAFVGGVSLSLEVLASDGVAMSLQATELEFDGQYDCKRVVAPIAAALPETVMAELLRLGERLALGLGLCGIMDLEVQANGHELTVLEIDARLPSQTPTAVYWSSGINVVSELLRAARGTRPVVVDRTPRCACIYQHVRVEGGKLEVVGEHALAVARPLTSVPCFYGADEALTDCAAGRESWVATLIATGPSVIQARNRAQATVEAIAADHHLTVMPESMPPVSLIERL